MRPAARISSTSSSLTLISLYRLFLQALNDERTVECVGRPPRRPPAAAAAEAEEDDARRRCSPPVVLLDKLALVAARRRTRPESIGI
jgi:hypothetical protein